jgi:hypothetical protein
VTSTFEILRLVVSSCDFYVWDTMVGNEREKQQNSASQKMGSLNLPQRINWGKKQRTPSWEELW